MNIKELEALLEQECPYETTFQELKEGDKFKFINAPQDTYKSFNDYNYFFYVGDYRLGTESGNIENFEPRVRRSEVITVRVYERKAL